MNNHQVIYEWGHEMKTRIPLWLLSFVVLGVVLAIPAGSAAAVDEWNARGPTAGYVQTLARDPENPQVVYGGLSNSSAYKSTDAGESWSPLSGLPATVSVIIFDPADHASIYAGGTNGLYNSRDAGATWIPVGTELSSEQIYSFVIPLSAHQNMLAGTLHNGIFRSTDGGDTWLQANTGLDSLQITLLSSDPSNPDIVYAAIHSYGIYKTVDGGSSWTAVNNGLSDSGVYSIVVDPTNSNRVYAGTWNGGVFVSENGGSSWAPAGSDLAGSYVPALAIDPEPPHTVYAGTEGGMMAVSSSRSPHMILSDDLLIFQPVDREGLPVQPGVRSAKVYLTNLFSLIMPLIKYELTDEVTLLDEPCPYGSGHRLIEDVQGRQEDGLVYPGGVEVHSYAF